MSQSDSRRRFEYFIVATIIAIIALVALDRYSQTAKKTRILRLEIISHHFLTAAANFRSEFLISKVLKNPNDANKGLLINGKWLYASPQGWPASVSPVVGETFRPKDVDCYQLWQLLLLNPAPITPAEFSESTHELRAFARAEACRYLSVVEGAYFDYFPLTGQLLFSVISN